MALTLLCACSDSREEAFSGGYPESSATGSDTEKVTAAENPDAAEAEDTTDTEDGADDMNTVIAARSHSDPELSGKYLDRAVEYAKTIHHLYWDSETCLSNLTPEGGTPYLWPFTEQSAMVNYILLAMEPDHPDREFFMQYLRELITGLRHYRVRKVNLGDGETWNDPDHFLAGFGVNDGTEHSYAIYCASRANKKIDNVVAKTDSVYFDDNVWVAKTYYYAWLNTGETAYLNEAVNIMNWILGEGYENAGELNGVYWRWSSKFKYKKGGSDTESASLNTCSTASCAMVLAKLVPALEGTPLEGLKDDYLAKAVSIFDFCTAVYVDPSSKCLYDKIMLTENFASETELKKQIQKTDKSRYAYNTGTYLTAGAELYSLLAESDPSKAELILNSAIASAKGADIEFADRTVKAGQYSYPSHSWFTSFLVSGFADLAIYSENCAEYEEHMRSALDYAWENHRTGDGLVSPAWIKGWSRFAGKNDINEDNPRQILYQSANAGCYAMLAEYYK